MRLDHVSNKTVGGKETEGGQPPDGTGYRARFGGATYNDYRAAIMSCPAGGWHLPVTGPAWRRRAVGSAVAVVAAVDNRIS